MLLHVLEELQRNNVLPKLSAGRIVLQYDRSEAICARDFSVASSFVNNINVLSFNKSLIYFWLNLNMNEKGKYCRSFGGRVGDVFLYPN